MPHKLTDITSRMDKLHIFEEDLLEKFILGSGKGGQKINKTSSCVYLKHIPTGIEIKCQKTRSQEMNRYFAREELCEKIEQEKKEKLLKEKMEKAKKRRANRPRSLAEKENVKIIKTARSQKKQLRQKLYNEE